MAQCPNCGKKGLKPKKNYQQATRKRGPKFLGSSAYCPSCKVSFKPKKTSKGKRSPMLSGGHWFYK